MKKFERGEIPANMMGGNVFVMCTLKIDRCKLDL